MGIFANIFGTSKATTAIVKTGLNLLDDAFYTTEEKSEDKRQFQLQMSNEILSWVKQTSGQRIARRFIAMIVTLLWSGLWATSVLLQFAAIFLSGEIVNELRLASDLAAESAENISGEFMLVLGFYFAAPHLGEMVKPLINRRLKE